MPRDDTGMCCHRGHHRPVLVGGERRKQDYPKGLADRCSQRRVLLRKRVTHDWRLTTDDFRLTTATYLHSPLARQRESRNRRARRGLVAPGALLGSRGCPDRRPARRAPAPLPATKRSRRGRLPCRGETPETQAPRSLPVALTHRAHVRSPPRRGSPPCAAGSRRSAPGARRWGWSPCPGRGDARRGPSA